MVVNFHNSIITMVQVICPLAASMALPGTANTRQPQPVLITGRTQWCPIMRHVNWVFFTNSDQDLATLIKPVKKVDHFRQRAAWSTFTFLEHPAIYLTL